MKNLEKVEPWGYEPKSLVKILVIVEFATLTLKFIFVMCNKLDLFVTVATLANRIAQDGDPQRLANRPAQDADPLRMANDGWGSNEDLNVGNILSLCFRKF